ncbi:MAG: V-type ATP synthase subunit E [Phycisphaerae bacterium]
MDIEQVTKKIIDEANEQAAQIKAACDDKLADYNRQTAEQIEKYHVHSKELAEKAAKEEMMRILATARMKSRSAILSKKREILARLDVMAAEKLAAISAEEFLKLTTKRLKELGLKGDEVIRPGKDEQLANEEWLEKINKALGTKLTFGEKANFSRGLSVVGGDVSVNMSFDMLIESAKSELEEKITSRLFTQ